MIFMIVSKVFMIRLMELIGADHSTRVPYERRELALEYIVQVHMAKLRIAHLYITQSLYV